VKEKDKWGSKRCKRANDINSAKNQQMNQRCIMSRSPHGAAGHIYQNQTFGFLKQFLDVYALLIA